MDSQTLASGRQRLTMEKNTANNNGFLFKKMNHKSLIGAPTTSSLSSQTPFLLRDKIALFDKYPPKLNSSSSIEPFQPPTATKNQQQHSERVKKLIRRTKSANGISSENKIYKQIRNEASLTAPLDSDSSISVPVLDFTSAERGSINFANQAINSELYSARTEGFQTVRLTKSAATSARSQQPLSSVSGPSSAISSARTLN